jgi:hypothetical protein
MIAVASISDRCQFQTAVRDRRYNLAITDRAVASISDRCQFQTAVRDRRYSKAIDPIFFRPR